MAELFIPISGCLLIKLFGYLKYCFLGAAIGTLLPPFNLPPYLIFIFLYPVLIATNRAKFRERILIGLFLGLGYFLVVLKWLAIVGPDALFVLSLICAGWWSMALSLSMLFEKSKYWPIWFACTWAAVETMRDHIPWGGFGWGQIGILWLDTPFAGLYATLGQIGMTFLTYLIVALLYSFYRSNNYKNLASGLKTSSLGLFLLIASYLSMNLQPIETDALQSVEIAAVQGGVEHFGLGVLGEPHAVLNRHLAQTRENLDAINSADLVVWPESSVDLDPNRDIETKQSLMQIDGEVVPPMLVNATTYTNDGYKQNSSLFMQDGIFRTQYQKRHLVPFGEFLPLRSLIEKYTERAQMLGTDYKPGNQSGNLQIERINLGLLICFEIADDTLIHENIENQSAIIVQTNNATYQFLGQTEQQAAYTRIRAIETQRPIISVSTSGESLVAMPNGDVVESISQTDTGLLNLRVNSISGRSISSTLHSLEVLSILIAFAGGLAFAIRRRFKIGS